jgi:hypothetical protein
LHPVPRERYVAVAEWGGGSVAREAKALAPSACVWAEQGKGTAPVLFQKILDCAIRCRDPFVRLEKRWIVRRLARLFAHRAGGSAEGAR